MFNIPSCENKNCRYNSASYHNRCYLTSGGTNPKTCKNYQPKCNKITEVEFVEFLSRFSDCGISKLRLEYMDKYLALRFEDYPFTELLKLYDYEILDIEKLLLSERKRRGIK